MPITNSSQPSADRLALLYRRPLTPRCQIQHAPERDGPVEATCDPGRAARLTVVAAKRGQTDEGYPTEAQRKHQCSPCLCGVGKSGRRRGL
jgi:hypothetical protein